ncbi:MAG: AraC family transcriptional regulator [Caulobacteraceae bacterium]
MAELTVAAGLARGLVELAVSKGARRSYLLAQAGIDALDLDDQDNRIGFARYVALMRAGQALCNDPALALHYGETNDMAQISVVGLIANASSNVVDALAQLNRYGRLVTEFDGGTDRFTMMRDAAGVWTVDNRNNPNDFPELTESTFARMICGPRHFGVTQLAKTVQVTHAAPLYRDEYQRVFGAPVTFGSDRNAILLDEKWLTHPVQLQPRYAFGVLSERAEVLLAELETSKSMRGKVERLLTPVLHTGKANMAALAGQMGMSRQTLFRRLKAEGATFEMVLDDLRRRLALDYLGARKVSVNEAAYLVGFSDPAAFSRAFKRWTGKSPRIWRDAPRD